MKFNFNEIENCAHEDSVKVAKENMKGFDFTEVSNFKELLNQFLELSKDIIEDEIFEGAKYSIGDVWLKCYTEIDGKVYCGVTVAICSGKMWESIMFKPFNCASSNNKNPDVFALDEYCNEFTKNWRIVLKHYFPEWKDAFKNYVSTKRELANKENEKHLKIYKENEEKINEEYNQNMYLANL